MSKYIQCSKCGSKNLSVVRTERNTTWYCYSCSESGIRQNPNTTLGWVIVILAAIVLLLGIIF